MTSEEILSLLREISKVTEPAMQQFWNAAVRQVVIATVYNGILSIVSIFATAAFLRLYREGSARHALDPKDGEVAMFIGGFCAMTFGGISGAAFYGFVGRIINPTWYAIRLLIGGI